MESFELSLLLIIIIACLFMIARTMMRYALLLAISLLCVYESVVGVFQLFGILLSNHYLYALTGSFNNPGPYGGFLSICISLLTAFCIKNRILFKGKLYLKIIIWVISITAIIAFIILPSTQSRSALLSIGCSMFLIVFEDKEIWNRIKPYIKKHVIWLTVGLTVLIVGAYCFKKPSADGRLFMNKICIKAMQENKWMGAGIGHFGGAYADAQAGYFKNQIEKSGIDDLDWRTIKENDRMTADCPEYAFNEYLFIGVENGFLAMILFISAIIITIITSLKRNTIWCYGMISFAVFAAFSYPLHSKLLRLFFVVLFASCLSDEIVQKEFVLNMHLLRNKRSLIVKYITLILSSVLLFLVVIKKKPEIKVKKQIELTWNKTDIWYKDEYYDYVVEDCNELFPIMQNNYHFLFTYGQSLNKVGFYEKSDSILMMGTRISSDPMFWNVMGNNSLAMGRYREAENRYKHAFYMVPNRLYPLYLLAKMFYIEGDSLKFMEMADIVDAFVPKVESTNTMNMRLEIKELKRDFYNRE